MSSRNFTPINMLIWLILAAAAAFLVFKTYRHEQDYAQSIAPQQVRILEGIAEIDDGDSLKINGQRVRLAGIDAPELHQFCQKQGESYACGEMAKNHLRESIGGRRVRCQWAEKDKYKRLLGRCFAGNVDLNRIMVAEGWAVDYSFAPDSDNNYKQEERAARKARLGIWQGRFQRPKNWRKQHPRF